MYKPLTDHFFSIMISQSLPPSVQNRSFCKGQNFIFVSKSYYLKIMLTHIIMKF